MDVIVRNFQSLKEAKIQISGFTLIVGESSQGKSAFLRALYAATNNRFKIGQVRNGTDFAEIKVRYSKDEPILIVKRSPTGSPLMKFNDKVYTKLGRSLPKEIEDYNNFGTLEVGNDTYSLNFHDQFSKPLLLEFSQKKVMELLSASKSIDDLNKVHYSLSKKREQNRGSFKTVDSLLNDSNAKLSIVKYEYSQFAPLYDKAKEVYESLKTLYAEVQNYDLFADLTEQHKAAETKLCSSRDFISNFRALNDSLDNEVSTLNKLESLAETIKHVEYLSTKKDILTKLNETYDKSLYEEDDNLTKMLNLLSEYKSTVALKDKYTSKIKLYQSCVDLNSEISKLQNTINTCDMYLYMLNQKDSLEKRNQELLEITQHRICPLCHTKLN